MTFIGNHLPELVPFMEDTYSPQAVNQARNSFKKKVRKASATFFYGAMCGFFTTDELDDLLFEASEVARFLLEVEGTTLDIDEEIDIEDRITKVMRSVGEAAKTILKSRAEESESPDQLPEPVHQKPKDDNILAVNHHPTVDKIGKDRKMGKKTKDHDPLPDSLSPESDLKHEEDLPATNKKIIIAGSLSTEDKSEESHINPVQEPEIVTTVVEKNTDIKENGGQ
jgi:hypothetical protein